MNIVRLSLAMKLDGPGQYLRLLQRSDQISNIHPNTSLILKREIIRLNILDCVWYLFFHPGAPFRCRISFKNVACLLTNKEALTCPLVIIRKATKLGSLQDAIELHAVLWKEVSCLEKSYD